MKPIIELPAIYVKTALLKTSIQVLVNQACKESGESHPLATANNPTAPMITNILLIYYYFTSETKYRKITWQHTRHIMQ